MSCELGSYVILFLYTQSVNTSCRPCCRGNLLDTQQASVACCVVLCGGVGEGRGWKPVIPAAPGGGRCPWWSGLGFSGQGPHAASTTVHLLGAQGPHALVMSGSRWTVSNVQFKRCHSIPSLGRPADQAWNIQICSIPPVTQGTGGWGGKLRET